MFLTSNRQPSKKNPQNPGPQAHFFSNPRPKVAVALMLNTATVIFKPSARHGAVSQRVAWGAEWEAEVGDGRPKRAAEALLPPGARSEAWPLVYHEPRPANPEGILLCNAKTAQYFMDTHVTATASVKVCLKKIIRVFWLRVDTRDSIAGR